MPKKPYFKWCLHLISFFLLSWLGIHLYVNYAFKNVRMQPFFNDASSKFWAHRGYTKKNEVYTLDAIQEALKMEYKGIELDLFYDASRNIFFVSHEFPYPEDVLILDAILEKYQGSINYWFDLKNLDKHNVNAISKLLGSMNEVYQLDNQFIIESKSGLNLRKLARKKLHTSYWINTSESQNFLMNYCYSMKNKFIIAHSNFNAISLPYYNYSTRRRNDFKHLNIHTWLYPQEVTSKNLEILSDREEVKVVLVDNLADTLHQSN